jgi:hypothetical protein
MPVPCSFGRLTLVMEHAKRPRARRASAKAPLRSGLFAGERWRADSTEDIAFGCRLSTPCLDEFVADLGNSYNQGNNIDALFP